ncbi:hypothetical protein TNCT_636051 [Trichonephila clavata]|uniref:Uncharacterized protein n=1 Tax=Trichonephila clavata TaxID=2740835 RepID=A0A8X6J4S1_TRICU|nr:hypothetical protein TNCT_636051 [Trichonephila clavata]
MKNMLTLLCILIFQDLGHSILLCKESFLQEGAKVSEILQIYERIVICKNCIDNTFGGFLFLLISLDLLSAFANITVVLGYETGKFRNSESLYCMNIFSIVNFSIFIYLLIAAADVNEKDKSFRNEIYLYVFKRRVRNIPNECALDIIAFGHESVAFSASGYFSFTKGFILTVIGGLLTYSLLLNQLQTLEN